jgi:hypothetical protein
LIIVADVVVLVERMAGQDQTECTRGERVLVSPDAWGNQQTEERAVQTVFLCVNAVIDSHFESTRGSDDELPTLLVGMGATVFAGRHIIDVEEALDVERHLHTIIYIGECAAWILFLGKVDYLAVVDGHGVA